MTRNLLHDTPRFTLVSHGNGLAYVLERKSNGRSVLFQGDDALTFHSQLDALVAGRIDMSYDNALGCLWYDYAESASCPGESGQALQRAVNRLARAGEKA